MTKIWLILLVLNTSYVEKIWCNFMIACQKVSKLKNPQWVLYQQKFHRADDTFFPNKCLIVRQERQKWLSFIIEVMMSSKRLECRKSSFFLI